MDWFDGHQCSMDLVQLTALAVSADGSRTLSDQLQSLGIDVLATLGPQEALDRLAIRNTEVSILGLSQDFVDGSADFVERIRQNHPELPIVTQTATGQLSWMSDELGIKLPLEDRICGTPWDDLYPSWLVERFESFVIDTFAEGFHESTFATQITMKANRGAHFGVASVIHLTGSTTGGRLAVYSTRAVLERLSDRLQIPIENPVERGMDLAGELANQIAGRFKAALHQRGTTVALGVPILIEGNNLSIRFGEGQPSLVAAVSTSAGALTVELCVGAALPAAHVEDRPDEVVDAGECELF